MFAVFLFGTVHHNIHISYSVAQGM